MLIWHDDFICSDDMSRPTFDFKENEKWKCVLISCRLKSGAGESLDKTKGFGCHKWGFNISLGPKIMKMEPSSTRAKSIGIYIYIYICIYVTHPLEFSNKSSLKGEAPDPQSQTEFFQVT